MSAGHSHDSIPHTMNKGIQICFFFRGPLGFDSGRLMTPFRKQVSSNLPKKTNDPNLPSAERTWLGSFLFGAGDRTRTGTPSLAVDFESTTSTIPSHRHRDFACIE